MTAKQILEICLASYPMLHYSEGEPLCRRTTFHIGGPCELLLMPSGREEICGVLSLLSGYGIRPFILGAGSNLLMPDGGYHGVVLSLRDHFNNVSLVEDKVIRAEAGASLAKLANFACEAGLTGLEFAQGIPGTVGGGVFMNAGAYGGELSQVISRVDYCGFDGSLHSASGEELAFGYRESLFQHREALILSADFVLEPGKESEIAGRMQDLACRRREKQPLEYPSAGSAFRRPAGYYAGALIEEAGLKGFRVGDAAVSSKHAGFIVNLGSASANDVKELISSVQKRVFENSGVLLEPEIRVIEDVRGE